MSADRGLPSRACAWLLSWFKQPRLTLTLFVLVGTSAALTHMAVFALSQKWLLAELANALGFVVAFGVSFVGHRYLSFHDTQRSTSESFWRFALTALLGFICNELVFVLLYRWFGWPSLLALFTALVAAAVQTFLLSRYWAFKA